VIFGSNLKKNYLGEQLQNKKQREKSTGLVSMLMVTDIFLWRRWTKESETS